MVATREGAKNEDSTRMMTKKKYYEILGVSKRASLDELKKAYKKAALKNHPDKGGDPHKFRELAEAYEVLKDPRQRNMYDHVDDDDDDDDVVCNPFATEEGCAWSETEMEAVREEVSKKTMMDGYWGYPGWSDATATNHNTYLHLPVSLEDLYLGATKIVPWRRRVICPSCNGKGVWTRESVVCSGCEGLKVVGQYKNLKVEIEKGMDDGDAITFPGEGHESPYNTTLPPGDLFIILRPDNHPIFRRHGNHLVVEHELSLTTKTLITTGSPLKFVIHHLDGRKIVVQSKPGQPIKPTGQFAEIVNEGMPVYKSAFTKGNLYIKFI